MISIQHFGILLVDDEYLLRNSMRRSLEAFEPEFKVEMEASDGASALKMLSSGGIQVMITDIRMPVMDGLELASRARELHPGLLTIILTGYADFNYAQEAIRNGVFEYLLKPVNEEDLQNVLTRARNKLLETYSLPEDHGSSRRSAEENVAYAVRYMKEHYMEDIDLGRLSSDMGFTSAYMTKLFNRYVGETPLKYLTSLRIQEAARLLKETSLSIAEVGEQVGYPDQFHFSKTFRKLTTKNPSAYRKEFQERRQD